MDSTRHSEHSPLISSCSNHQQEQQQHSAAAAAAAAHDYDDGGDGNSTTTTSSHRRRNHHHHQSGVAPEKIGWKSVCFFVFLSTSSGCFGLEGVVSGAGPLITILLIVIMPVLVSVPMILMIGEMASMMPSNHGSIRWVTRAYGPLVGFFNAFCQVMMNLTDLAVYPSMAVNYLLRAFAPHLLDEFWPKYLMRVAIIIVTGIPTFFPMKTMGMLSAVVSLVIITPFLVGICAALPTVDSSSWSETTDEIKLSSILSLAVWVYSGFLGGSTIAGEVEPTDLLKGQMSALGLDVLMYLLPIIVIFQTNTDWSSWDDGYISVGYQSILTGLGPCVAIAGFISGVSLYSSSLVCYARCAWGVADLGWMPKTLTGLNRYGAPYVSVLLHMLVAIILNTMDFEFLVRLEFIFGTFQQIFFASSFIVLRFKEPDEVRPFRIPGGNVGAVLLPLPLIFIMAATLGSTLTDWVMAVSAVGAVAVAMSLYYYLTFVGRSEEEVHTRATHLRSSVVRGLSFIEIEEEGSEDDDDDDGAHDLEYHRSVSAAGVASDSRSSVDRRPGGENTDYGSITAVATAASSPSSSTDRNRGRGRQQQRDSFLLGSHRIIMNNNSNDNPHDTETTARASTASSSGGGGGGGVRRSALSEYDGLPTQASVTQLR